MNHSLFAGFFCTLAFILLFIETIFLKNKVLPKYFFGFYALGCLGWLSLGVVSDQVSLVLISVIQFLFCYLSYKYNRSSYE